jgi:hypothetical protein
VEHRLNTKISGIINTYTYMQNMYPKVGLLEETKEEGKEEKIVNNNEIHHICIGTKHNETY